MQQKSRNRHRQSDETQYMCVFSEIDSSRQIRLSVHFWTA